MAEEVREVREEPTRDVVVERNNSSSAGTIIAVVVGIIIVALLLIYGLPALSSNNSGTDVNVSSPAPTTPTTGTGN
ncbi:MAG TPA: hypothetical protein VL362_02000 [Patescibacteria group bacterium]|jgi:hypothetical protein|nr:hypothetical protein [Patescibacteria group bacterium]